MITRERLEELALTTNGKVKLYGIGKNNNVFCVGKNFSAVRNWKNKDRLNSMIDSATRLFETKEEAEFEVKYKNITRTETLSLPTWEEIQETKYCEFFSKDYDYMLQYQPISKKIALYDRNNKGDYYLEEATKDNYLKACEIVRKLFLGEEV